MSDTKHINEDLVTFLQHYQDPKSLYELQQFLHKEGILQKDPHEHALVFDKNFLEILTNNIGLQERSRLLRAIAQRFEELEKQLAMPEYHKYAAKCYLLTNDEIHVFEQLLQYFEKSLWQSNQQTRSQSLNYLRQIQRQLNFHALKGQDYRFFQLRSRTTDLLIEYHLASGEVIQQEQLKELNIQPGSPQEKFARRNRYIKPGSEKTAYEALLEAQNILSTAQIAYFRAKIIALLDSHHHQIESFLAREFDAALPAESQRIRLLKSAIFRQQKRYHQAMQEVTYNLLELIPSLTQLLLGHLVHLTENVNAGKLVHQTRKKILHFTDKLFGILQHSLEENQSVKLGRKIDLQQCQLVRQTVREVSKFVHANEDESYYYRERALQSIQESLAQVQKLRQEKAMSESSQLLYPSIVELFHVLIGGKNLIFSNYRLKELYQEIPLIMEAMAITPGTSPKILVQIEFCRGKWLREQPDSEKLSDQAFRQAWKILGNSNLILRNEIFKEWEVGITC